MTRITEVNDIVDVMQGYYSRKPSQVDGMDYIKIVCNDIAESNSYEEMDAILCDLKQRSNFYSYHITRLYSGGYTVCVSNYKNYIDSSDIVDCSFEFVKNSIAIMLHNCFEDGSFRLDLGWDK